MLMVSEGNRHPTENCDLAGARMAIAVETEEGRRLAESFIKQITGGEDRLKGRRMREDYWEFDATHKLWISGNHKPNIRGTDDGIWDRIRLIPFHVRFESPDKTLPAQLHKERSGILNWLLAGCCQWLAEELHEPDDVKKATGQYKAEMDILGQFLDEELVLGQSLHVGASTLYERFKDWDGNMSQHRFGKALTERSFENGRFTAGLNKGRKFWKGLGLRAFSEDTSEP